MESHAAHIIAHDIDVLVQEPCKNTARLGSKLYIGLCAAAYSGTCAASFTMAPLPQYVAQHSALPRNDVLGLMMHIPGHGGGAWGVGGARHAFYQSPPDSESVRLAAQESWRLDRFSEVFIHRHM